MRPPEGLPPLYATEGEADPLVLARWYHPAVKKRVLKLKLLQQVGDERTRATRSLKCSSKVGLARIKRWKALAVPPAHKGLVVLLLYSPTRVRAYGPAGFDA